MINDETNPSGFLSNGSPGGLFIHQVSEPGETISFVLNPEYGLLSGFVNVDNPEIDLTGIEILFSDQVMNPGSNGLFLFLALCRENIPFPLLYRATPMDFKWLRLNLLLRHPLN